MSLFRPYWWPREGDDADEQDHDLASTGAPIRRPPDHQPHPRRRLANQPAWVRIAVAVVLVVGTVRLLGSVEAWVSCGADTGQAWVLAIQGLGAKPSALECLGVGLDQTSGPGEQATPTEPPTTEPPPLVTNPDGSPVLYPNGDGTFHDSRYGTTDCAHGGCTAYGPCPGGVPPASHFVCQDP
ncbi:MAG TPA: hypothetical protein VFA45_13630 [Actinomycetes bacterium]|nr:hypothetical protein [Actinomycetes bacterium]